MVRHEICLWYLSTHISTLSILGTECSWQMMRILVERFNITNKKKIKKIQTQTLYDIWVKCIHTCFQKYKWHFIDRRSIFSRCIISNISKKGNNNSIWSIFRRGFLPAVNSCHLSVCNEVFWRSTKIFHKSNKTLQSIKRKLNKVQQWQSSRFEDYPLDSHVCKFRVGSSSHNDQKMK